MMYRTYNLTDEDKRKLVIQHWDGDSYSYTVCETQEEYDKEKKRIAKIEYDYRNAKDNYLKSIGVY